MLLLSALAILAQDSLALSIRDQVRRQIETSYYRQNLPPLDWAAVDTSSESALYPSLNRLLATLKDSHTTLTTAAGVRQRRAQSRLGLGFETRHLDGQLAVVHTQPGSPADQAGIRRGFMVSAIGGSPVPPVAAEFEGWIRQINPSSLCEKGPVSLAVEDTTLQPRELTLDCALISDAPRRESSISNGRLIVAFDRFDAASARWFEQVLDSHPEAQSLLLDLRGNVGGYRSALLSIAGRLLGEKALGESVSRRGKTTVWKTKSRKSFTAPITVLIDSASASSAEILAANLRLHARARLVGRPSSGSVLLMIRQPLPGGGELSLSIEDFHLPNGERLEGKGVTPDQIVPLTLAALRSPADPDLDAALATQP